MASFAKVTLVGYLGRDPEIRYTADGTPVTSFSVATTEKRKGESVTTWFKINAWQKLAEITNQYLSKGSQVYVEGRLSQSEYTAQDGTTRTSLEVRATDVQFLTPITESKPTENSQPVDDDDTVPF